MGQGGRRYLTASLQEHCQFSLPSEDISMGEEPSPSPSSYSSDAGVSTGYIEHRVSKLDTLAGVAIKYGVEVADIKRVNGLVTDIQMFAHKMLKIALPGRHPPSATLRNSGISGSSSALTPRLGNHVIHSANSQLGSSANLKSRNCDKRPVSMAMNLLRGYYGLSSPAQPDNEGTEMILYNSNSKHYSEEDRFLTSIASDDLQVVNKGWPTCKDSINGAHAIPLGNAGIVESFVRLDETIFQEEVDVNVGTGDIEKATDRSVRRRSKVDGTTSTMGSSEVAGRQQVGTRERTAVGKSPPPRPKIMSKTSLVADASNSLVHPFIISSGVDGLSGTLQSGKTIEGLISKVRRSSSTSNLQEEKVVNANSGSRYGSKIDSIALNQPSFNPLGPMPLFEGLSKPIGSRHNKAALD